MGFAPGLHAQEVGRAAEVVAALGRIAPAVLAGGLAGLAAGRLRTVSLVKAITRVGLVQLSAFTALTPPRGCHDLRNIGEAPRTPTRPPASEEDPKEEDGRRRPEVEENDLLKGTEEDPAEEDPHFQTG